MEPKVSVLMLAYNQEQYIAQAIESILTQEVNVPYEIVIGEDCSTDRTEEICHSYQQKYPDKIHLLIRDKNLGMAGNFLDTLRHCKGQYLAILEGDDFWVDPSKLQEQVDFLDANPDFTVVFTQTEAFLQSGKCSSYGIPLPNSAPYTLENLLRINFIATCSVMYRWGLLSDFPKWLGEMEMLDWPFHLLHAEHGKIGFIDHLMAKYRIHDKSNYSSRNRISNFKGVLKFYKVINKHFGYKYCNLIYRQYASVYYSLASCFLVEKQRFNWLQNQLIAYVYELLSHVPNRVLMSFKAM